MAKPRLIVRFRGNDVACSRRLHPAPVSSLLKFTVWFFCLNAVSAWPGQRLGGRQQPTGELAVRSEPTTAASRPLWLKGLEPKGGNAAVLPHGWLLGYRLRGLEESGKNSFLSMYRIADCLRVVAK